MKKAKYCLTFVTHSLKMWKIQVECIAAVVLGGQDFVMLSHRVALGLSHKSILQYSYAQVASS